MEKIEITKAKNALESFIKGLLQDFINETGACVASIEINHAINPDTHRRVIKEVKVLEDVQVVSAVL